MSNESQIDLKYDPHSFVGPFDKKAEQEMHEFEAWLEQSGDGEGRIKFDPSYVEHLRQFHGGVPKKRCFRTESNMERSIDRFLHFGLKSLPRDSPLRVNAVKRAWSDADDRLGPYLMPFADLFAGDMLCFDYSRPGRPRIVVWYHEESDEDAPVTEFVAENFDEFLPMLYEYGKEESQQKG